MRDWWNEEIIWRFSLNWVEFLLLSDWFVWRVNRNLISIYVNISFGFFYPLCPLPIQKNWLYENNKNEKNKRKFKKRNKSKDIKKIWASYLEIYMYKKVLHSIINLKWLLCNSWYTFLFFIQHVYMYVALINFIQLALKIFLLRVLT